MRFVLEKIKKNYFELILFFWCTYLLHPILGSGLLADDAYNFQIGGKIIDENISILKVYLNETYGWLKVSGRIFPLHWYVYFLNYFVNNLLLLKLIILLLNLILFFTIFKVIKLLKNNNLAILFIIFFTSIYFFRNNFDPIITWNGRNQLIFIFFFLSIFHLIKFEYFKKSINKNLSYIFYLISILFYEIAYLNFLIIFLIIFNFNRDKKFIEIIRRNFFYTSTSIILIILSILFKSNYSPFYIFNDVKKPEIYAGAKFDLSNFFESLILQLSTTLDFYKNYFDYDYLFVNLQFLDYLFFIFSVPFITIIFSKIFKKKNLNNLKFIFLIGLLNILIPAIIISVSSKYQNYFLNGTYSTYSNIYYQVIGFAIVLASLLCLFSIPKKNLRLLISFFFSLLVVYSSATSLSSNIDFNNQRSLSYKKTPLLIDKSLDKGIFENVYENSIILQNRKLPVDWYWYYARKTKKIYNFCELKNFFSENCLKKKYFFEDELFDQNNLNLNLINHNIYAFYYYFNKKNLSGFANLYKISTIKKKNNEIEIYANEALVYNEKENTLSKKIFERSLNIVNLFNDIENLNKLLREDILKINE